MKYYLIIPYTCYGGEHSYHYVAIPENESLEDEKWIELFQEWVWENATEWWNDEVEETFEGDFEAYLAECGYDIEEISEEEYLANCEKE